jgi:hypothetical protein
MRKKNLSYHKSKVPIIIIVCITFVCLICHESLSQDAAPEASVEVNFDYFHDQLAPYGTWLQVGGVTYWRPDAAIRTNPDWRPYYDLGQWVQTDNGLFWQSDYNWGDIPFHYGRWIKDPAQGWLWLPDYTWGPSWVFWRDGESDSCLGWAPLPPGAGFVGGVLMFNGAAVSVDFDFGLGADCFTFVSYDHFHDRFMRLRGREYPYHIEPERVREFYGRSVIRNNFRSDEHGRMINDCIGRDRLARVTNNRLEHSGFEERDPVGNRNNPHVGITDRPVIHGILPDSTPAGIATKPQNVPALPVRKVYRPPIPAASFEKKY